MNTDLAVQAATHSTVSATLLVQILDKVGLITTSLICDGVATLREELQCRERLNFIFLGERSVKFGVRVDVCNNTLRVPQ
jgi:hypothetical protein